MDKLSLRIYFFLSYLFCTIHTWAQDDDEFLDPRQRGRDIEDIFDMNSGADYQAIHFNLSDILLIILLIVACYVFGKIWKGCIYLLLAFAAMMYFLA